MDSPHAPYRREDCEQYLDRALSAVGWRIRLVDALTALVGTVGVVLAYLVSAVLVDHAMDGGLPLTIRRIAVIGLALLGAAGAGLWVVRPTLKRLNRGYLAWLVERHFPEFHNGLITTLELRRRQAVNSGVLAGLLLRVTGEMTSADAPSSVPTHGLRRGLLASSCCAVAILFYAMVSPKAVWPSVLRAFGLDVPAPTSTQVAWLLPEPGQSVVRGSVIPFEVRLTGRIPEHAAVEFSVDEGRAWTTSPRLELQPADAAASRSGGIWSAVRQGRDVQASMLCRVVAGDCVSEARGVEVRPIPTVTAIEVRYDYPEYVGMAGEARPGPDVDAPVGTRVTLTGRSNVPLGAAVFRYSDAAGSAARRMEIDPADAKSFRTSWTIDSDMSYRLGIEDRYGVSNVRPLSHRVWARPDAPPVVEWIAPEADLEVEPGGAVGVRAVGRDDYGLTDAAIVYRAGTVEGRISLTDRLGERARVWEVNEAVPVEAFGIVRGQSAEYRLEIRDNRHDAAGKPAYQTATGPVHRVRISAPVALAKSRTARDSKGEQGASRDEKDGPGDGRNVEERSGSGKAEGGGDVGDSDDLDRLARALGEGEGEANRDRSGDDDPTGMEDDESGGPGDDSDQTEKADASSSSGDQQGEDAEESGESGKSGEHAGREDAEHSEKASRDDSERDEQDGDETDDSEPEDSNQPPSEVKQGDAEPKGEQSESRDSPKDETPSAECEGQDSGASTVKSSSADQEESGKNQTNGRGATEGGEQASGGEAGESDSGKKGAAGKAGQQSSEGGARGDSESKDEEGPEEELEKDGRFEDDEPNTPSLKGTSRGERAVNELERRLREGKLDPELLKQLGWSEADAVRFVQEYRRRAARGQKQQDRSRLADRTQQVRHGESGKGKSLIADNAGREIGGRSEQLSTDGRADRGVRAHARETVPPEYQDLLDAYYRTMARDER